MRLLVVSQTLLLVASVIIAGPVAAVKPSPSPSATPAPTAEPTPAPTPEPTPAPTPEPTPAPTADPTSAPTTEPTAVTRPSNRAPIPRPRRVHRRSRAHRRAPIRVWARSRQSRSISQLSTLAASVSALQFAGTSPANQYVTFGAAPSLGLSTFTVEAWIKRTGTGVTTSTSAAGGGGLLSSSRSSLRVVAKATAPTST